MFNRLFVIFAVFLLTACGGAAGTVSDMAEEATESEATAVEAPTTVEVSAAVPTEESQLNTEAAASAAETADTDSEVPATVEALVETPVPIDTPSQPEPTPEPLFYNLPAAELTNASGLYASPNRSELIAPVPIPEGEKIFVMGRNATRTHLRVVWNTGVGWIPVGFTSYNNERSKMDVLPVFEHEPPKCAVPITTQFGLNSQWQTDVKQRVAVVVDLFRSKFGEFPQSSLSLTVNGNEVPSTRRQIVEQGQFSLKDVVFTLDQDVHPGDSLGYLLDTASDEPLTFMATIFSVPSNCVWETK